MKINVIKHCDSAPPSFIVIDLSLSAFKEVGKGIYKGTADEIYVEYSDKEVRECFGEQFKQILSLLNQQQNVKGFFDRSIQILTEQEGDTNNV